MVCLFARKHKIEIDTTQELYAYGFCNILSSLFTCYPSAGSLSRSSVLEVTGGRSMLSGLFGAVVILFVILFAGPLFESLPKAVLASIIVAAFKSILLQAVDMFKLWKINKFESVKFYFFLTRVILYSLLFWTLGHLRV